MINMATKLTPIKKNCLPCNVPKSKMEMSESVNVLEYMFVHPIASNAR